MTELRWNTLGLAVGTAIECNHEQQKDLTFSRIAGVITKVDEGFVYADYSKRTGGVYRVHGIEVDFDDGSTCIFVEDDVEELNLTYK